MTDILNRLRTPSEVHTVELCGDGFGVVAKPDRIRDFSLLVREAINEPGAPFAVFATLVTGTRDGYYERAHILPFDNEPVD